MSICVHPDVTGQPSTLAWTGWACALPPRSPQRTFLNSITMCHHRADVPAARYSPPALRPVPPGRAPSARRSSGACNRTREKGPRRWMWPRGQTAVWAAGASPSPPASWPEGRANRESRVNVQLRRLHVGSPRLYRAGVFHMTHRRHQSLNNGYFYRISNKASGKRPKSSPF